MQSDEKLDGYTVFRRIGTGGFGEVWLCRSDALGDFRAMKFISAANTDSLEKEFKALVRYRNAAPRLRSPHLMPIEHVGLSSEGLYGGYSLQAPDRQRPRSNGSLRIHESAPGRNYLASPGANPAQALPRRGPASYRRTPMRSLP